MSCGTGALLCELDTRLCRWLSVTLLGSKNLLNCRSDLSGRGNPGPPKGQVFSVTFCRPTVSIHWGHVPSWRLLGFLKPPHLRTIMGSPSFEVPNTLRLFWLLSESTMFFTSLVEVLLFSQSTAPLAVPSMSACPGYQREKGLRDISHEVGECLSKLGTAFDLCLCDGNSVGNKMWRDVEIQTSCLVLS